MIDTNTQTISPKLHFFNFDLDHFVANHLAVAIKDVHVVRKISQNHDGKLTCTMGFIANNEYADRKQPVKYRTDLSTVHFTIAYLLKSDGFCLAVKPKVTYKIADDLSDHDVAVKLLNYYVEWIKRRINKMNTAVNKLDFTTLIKTILPAKINPRLRLSYFADHIIDDVFTRQSLLAVISQNLIPCFNCLVKASHQKENQFYDYYYDYQLYWLLEDKDLREYFILCLLQVGNLKKQMKQNNHIGMLISRIIEIILGNIDTNKQKPTNLDQVFLRQALDWFNPVVNTLSKPETWKRSSDPNYLVMRNLIELENYLEQRTLIYPIFLIDQLAEYSYPILDDYHFAITSKEDLEYLLTHCYVDVNNTRALFHIKSVLSLLSREQIDLNGYKPLLDQKLAEIEQTKPNGSEQSVVRILNKLLSLN